VPGVRIKTGIYIISSVRMKTAFDTRFSKWSEGAKTHINVNENTFGK
jgi:hypothetical protein